MTVKNSKSIFRIVLLYCSIVVIVFTSCTKMDYYYKDLVRLGDKVYIGKVDSVWAYPGNERLKLAWSNPSDPAASQIIVYWNNNKDSVTSDIDRSVDTGFVIIEGLAEGSYNLSIVTTDKKGNRSVPVGKSTVVYGDSFQQTLRTRDMDHVVVFKDSIMVFWNEILEEAMMVGSEVHYFDKDGEARDVFTPNDAMQTSIYDVDTTQGIFIRSFFMPDSMALDTFKTAYKRLNLAELQIRTLTLTGVGASTADFIDFAMVTVHDYEYSAMHPERIDMAHLRGSSSRHNFISITNDAGFAAFSSSLRDDIIGWPVRNDTKMVNLGDDPEYEDLYNGLDENDRAAMIAAYEDAASVDDPSGRLTKIEAGDIILLRSVDRDIYVAIKVIESDSSGSITIEFKISRF